MQASPRSHLEGSLGPGVPSCGWEIAPTPSWEESEDAADEQGEEELEYNLNYPIVPPPPPLPPPSWSLSPTTFGGTAAAPDTEDELLEDEWENDDDPGYVVEYITESQFFAMEEEAAAAAESPQADIPVIIGGTANGERCSSAGSAAGEGREETDEEAAYIGLNEAAAAAIGQEATLNGGADSVPGSSALVGELLPLPPPRVPDVRTGGSSGDPLALNGGGACSGAGGSAGAAAYEAGGDLKAGLREGEPPSAGEDVLRRLGLSAQTEVESFELKVYNQRGRCGFEESKDFYAPPGATIIGRYKVRSCIGKAAFSTALQCEDLLDANRPVCLKVIKNSKEFFDQSLDELRLLRYIRSRGDPDRHHVLKLLDSFYFKEHLFLVSELLRENLYDFGRVIRDQGQEPYFTLPRIQRIARQCLEALTFVHGLNLIHADIKPENIVLSSYSRCDVKLIDFGSSAFATDSLSSYVQSRSYRAPEVLLGLRYDHKIDLFSLGAVLAELATGAVLFQSESVPTLLARMQGIMGNMPERMLSLGREVPKLFTTANVLYERIVDPLMSGGRSNSLRGRPPSASSAASPGGGGGGATPDCDSARFALIFPKQTSLAHRLRKDQAFVSFVAQLLALDPLERFTADEALRGPWMQQVMSTEEYWLRRL